MTAKRQHGRDLLNAMCGLLIWTVFVAVPARDNPEWSGAGYFPALFALAAVLGCAFPESHLRGAATIVAPAALSALWTAPTGDNDGLQVLWVPLLALSILPAALFHWLGETLRRFVPPQRSSKP
jgi:hypothetical protein